MLTDPFYVAAIALALSFVATAARLMDWFLHSDSRSIARASRWTVALLAIVSIPLLVTLLLNQRWEAAMGLGALMLFSFSLFGRRFLRRVTSVSVLLDTSKPSRAPSAGRSASSTEELAWRAAGVLEEYLRSVNGTRVGANLPLALPSPQPAAPSRSGRRKRAQGAHQNGAHVVAEPVERISREDALAILGLDRRATPTEVERAHKRLSEKLRPDRGGSHYLFERIGEARRVLIGDAVGTGRKPAAPRKPRRASPGAEP